MGRWDSGLLDSDDSWWYLDGFKKGENSVDYLYELFKNIITNKDLPNVYAGENIIGSITAIEYITNNRLETFDSELHIDLIDAVKGLDDKKLRDIQIAILEVLIIITSSSENISVFDSTSWFKIDKYKKYMSNYYELVNLVISYFKPNINIIKNEYSLDKVKNILRVIIDNINSNDIDEITEENILSIAEIYDNPLAKDDYEIK